MRDEKQEEAFVDAFIEKARRDRYKSLLANPRRRDTILDRLNHRLDFIPSLANQIPAHQHTPDEVIALLQKWKIKDTDPVYIFSDVRELDGRTLALRQALVEVIYAVFGSVICCLPGQVAYYQPEAPERGYLLVKVVSGYPSP